MQLSGPSFPPRAGGPPQQLVVFLHGLGADGNDLIGIAPLLAQDLPNAEFVSPNAPYPCDMAPFGRQWFSFQNMTEEALLARVRASGPILDKYLTEALADRGLDDSKLALFGFSQGCMMALYVAPRRDKPCAGVLGFSGALIGADLLPTEETARPPVLLVHGDADEVVPFHNLGLAERGLGAAGLTVHAHRRPGLGHGIDEEGLQLARSFLRDIFSG